ncbi:apolipoprotein N-acyltransferase [Pontibacter sp. FD36]|uniref:apolipoprotein N-acyltransferase n=1 Tax=Pontibacter sp. FD36 TaxID=2789860 RepID=UPI0018ABD766|nr:apolipoprotein N-acyltransferase [Pontibacter sp. FD36]MBF8964111.1 apolipoprotein N-acyltransferase [Pontibacter sp. FD36]
MLIQQLRIFTVNYSYTAVIISAILTSISLILVNYVIACFALIFLFLPLCNVVQVRQAVYIGAIFGAVSAGILNYWMIPAIARYAQSSLTLGIGCWLLSVLVISSLYALQFAAFAKARFANTSFVAICFNAFLMASFWVIFEWMRAALFAGMPWLSYSIGISQAGSLFMAQSAAAGSVYMLSFLLVLVNYTFSHAIHSEAWRWLLLPVLILVTQFIAGVWLYYNISQQAATTGHPKISTALVLASLPPETVWNEHNGNALVERLLSLNEEAVVDNPDLILWSETVIPWTYSADDDFLKEVSKATSGKNAHFLLGMSTAVDQNSNAVFNSAYFFNPTGEVLDRHDKHELLTLIERPLFNDNGNIILPFLSGNGLVVQQGARQQAIKTPWGQAGVLLCNESAVPALTNRLASDQVSFLINLGNDGWFSDFFITKQHFYNGRLRAIEARKDLVINNNRGVSGLIRASGDIGARYHSERSSVQRVDIYPNQIAPIDYHYFLYTIFSATVLLLLVRFYRRTEILSA